MNILQRTKQEGREQERERIRSGTIEILRDLEVFGGQENAGRVIGRIMGLLDINPDELMREIMENRDSLPIPSMFIEYKVKK